MLKNLACRLLLLFAVTFLSGCQSFGDYFEKSGYVVEPGPNQPRARVLLASDYGSSLLSGSAQFYMLSGVDNDNKKYYLYKDNELFNDYMAKDLGMKVNLPKKLVLNQVHLPSGQKLRIYADGKGLLETCRVHLDLELKANQDYVLSLNKFKLDGDSVNSCTLQLYQVDSRGELVLIKG